jgi:hypothetical protein
VNVSTLEVPKAQHYAVIHALGDEKSEVFVEAARLMHIRM